MKSLTRTACITFSRVSLPSTCVRTGPSDGINSFNACAWNCTTDSCSIGWNTPDEPLNGLVRSSIVVPRSSRPSLYIFSHCSREDLSASNNAIKSFDISDKTSSGSISARLASYPSSLSSSSPILTVTPPSSSSSISTSGMSSSADTSISMLPDGKLSLRSIGIVLPYFVMDIPLSLNNCLIEGGMLSGFNLLISSTTCGTKLSGDTLPVAGPLP